MRGAVIAALILCGCGRVAHLPCDSIVFKQEDRETCAVPKPCDCGPPAPQPTATPQEAP